MSKGWAVYNWLIGEAAKWEKKRQFIRVLFKNKEILAVIDLKITISKINN